MRLLPFLLLAACGRLGPFTEFREDTADTGDTAFDDTAVDTADTDTGPVDTDTGPVDTDTGPATQEGVYTGSFTMSVTVSGIGFPIDNCAGTAQIVVTTGSASGSFDCPFTGLLGQTLGAQSGELTASVAGAAVVDPYATMGLFFVFDDLTGNFQGTTRLTLSEVGTVSLDLGDYDYTASFDVRK